MVKRFMRNTAPRRIRITKTPTRRAQAEVACPVSSDNRSNAQPERSQTFDRSQEDIQSRSR
jgi:hypothetical protein